MNTGKEMMRKVLMTDLNVKECSCKKKKKKKKYGPVQLYCKENITVTDLHVSLILNHHQAFIQNLQNTEVLQALCITLQWDLPNAPFLKILKLWLYSVNFLFSVSNSLPLLCLDGNIFLLKLRSLISMSNSVPARECIIWDVEQVLILETNFVVYIKKKLKKPSIHSKMHTVTCYYAVLCFIMNIIFGCLHCTMLCSHRCVWK